MKILLYANSPEKAGLLLPWVKSLSSSFATEVVVQTTREPARAERAAAEMLEAELAQGGAITLRGARAVGGSPEEVIADEVLRGDYNLVIVAPAGRRGFIRLFYGSMVAKVVRRVSTSVMIVRAGAVPPRRILVGVSGSRHSLTNVRAAAQLGVIYGATVTIMMVLSQLPVEFSGPEAGARKEDFLKSDHPPAVHLRTGQDLLRNLGAKGNLRVVEGLVVDEVLEELETIDHDLLVLGTHRAEDYDPMYEDLTSELVQKSPRTTMVVGLRADLI